MSPILTKSANIHNHIESSQKPCLKETCLSQSPYTCHAVDVSIKNESSVNISQDTYVLQNKHLETLE